MSTDGNPSGPTRIQPLTDHGGEESPLGLEPESIGDAGPDLETPEDGEPEPAPRPAPRFGPETPTTAAAAETLGALLVTVEANLPGLRQEVDVEFLHDVRVAVRRARSLLRELRSALPEEGHEELREALGWLADLTSPVRDLDVLLESLPGYAAKWPEGSRLALEPLVSGLRDLRRRRLADLLAALDSPAGEALLADWRLEIGRLNETPGPPLGEVADRRLRKLGRRVAKHAVRVTRRSPPSKLHRLRIEAKRLRYLLEFVQSLYHPDRVAPLLRALRRLQDALGELQDLAVQGRQLEALAPAGGIGGPPAAFVAVGRLLAGLEQRARRRRRKVEKVIRRFAHDAPEQLVELAASPAEPGAPAEP